MIISYFGDSNNIFADYTYVSVYLKVWYNKDQNKKFHRIKKGAFTIPWKFFYIRQWKLFSHKIKTKNVIKFV